MSLRTSVVASLRDVPAAAWDALVDGSDPFLEHAFLLALEDSASVGPRAGWIPRFVLAHRGRDLVGAVPLYLKSHSMGEFVFDWGWASGAARAGIAYYPKLVAAVPFTPATGQRLLVAPGEAFEPVAHVLVDAIDEEARARDASSVHVLFCLPQERDLMAEHGYMPRLGFQFHWHNRTPTPYADFEDFLGTFRAENRKQVRKERRVAGSHGLELVTREGTALSDEEWRALEVFYLSNADKHGAHTYLQPKFFPLLRERLAHRVLATLALRDGRPVAGSLNFERGKRLYGRYWGCVEEHPMLHFELCYHRLIERSIVRGYERMEAGAQGEHKLKRGLLPNETWSVHHIRHPGLAQAIRRWLAEETRGVRADLEAYAAHGPTRRGPPPADPEP